ncbi:MAG: hypothetical protein MZV63_62005 [Marinilabiliales bacterium]|nr:hypothetical protein [Marinilabiliales bacterium]
MTGCCCTDVTHCTARKPACKTCGIAQWCAYYQKETETQGIILTDRIAFIRVSDNYFCHSQPALPKRIY